MIRACVNRGCKRPPREGYALCESCARVQNASNRRWYRNQKHLNLCVHCGAQPPAEGVVRCAACREKHAARSRARYRKQTEQRGSA